MRWLLLMPALAAPAAADTLVAARTIRAETVLGPADVVVAPAEVPGALSDPAAALGQEARVALYAGRPIRPGDLGPPAVVERNQLVTLHYRAGPVAIAVEGRALDRAGVGDRLRVMNLGSRATVSGTVAADGSIRIAPDLP